MRMYNVNCECHQSEKIVASALTYARALVEVAGEKPSGRQLAARSHAAEHYRRGVGTAARPLPNAQPPAVGFDRAGNSGGVRTRRCSGGIDLEDLPLQVAAYDVVGVFVVCEFTGSVPMPLNGARVKHFFWAGALYGIQTHT